MSKHLNHADVSDKTPKIWESQAVCKPLDSFSAIMMFLENPPPWRTLSQELTPHSDFLIRNSEVIAASDSENNPEKIPAFCHFDPDRAIVKRHASKSLPKTLVCHDMANGYHDDCAIEGTTNSEAYTFYNWAGIDIFCYFSHHLVTIPPVGWINVGHAHGVKVIGTVITEHAQGTTFWDEVLVSETQYLTLASALVAIAKSFKFDGYLLNIENKVSRPGELLKFVRHLHRMLHDELPHATLIWYDSVTEKGKLNWQNSLNEKNKVFFDACDGLFTNYSWSPDDVAASAALAGARLADLYIGIDVWGRNFFGGGQFNTAEAVKVARAAGCSIALFAVAWTHEALAADEVGAADALGDYDKWLLRDRALWDSLWPLLHTRLPARLPFHSSFCRGYGRKRYLYGEVLCPSPWYNLRHQQYQPNAAHGAHGYQLANLADVAKAKSPYKDKKGIMRIRSSYHEPQPEQPPSAAAEPKKESSSDSDNNEPDDAAPASSARSLRAMPSASSTQPSVAVDLGRQQHKRRYGLVRVAAERACLELHVGDAFTGGACLMVHPSDARSPEHRHSRLLHCDFRCERALVVCVVTKTLAQHPQQTLSVRLAMLNAAGQELLLVLAGRQLAQTEALGARAAGVHYVYPLRTHEHAARARLRAQLLLTQPDFYVPIDNAFGWNVRYYEVDVPGARVLSADLRTGVEVGPILLGHFGIASKTYT